MVEPRIFGPDGSICGSSSSARRFGLADLMGSAIADLLFDPIDQIGQ
jgi:hypothetical protein